MSIYDKVAEIHNTTADNVRHELEEALKEAGIRADPEELIREIAAMFQRPPRA